MYRGGAATMGLGVAGRTVGKREISPAVSDRWGRRRSEASGYVWDILVQRNERRRWRGTFLSKKIENVW